MGEDLVSTLLGWIILFAFIIFYPRLMLSQLLNRLESSAQALETLSKRARVLIMKKIGRRDKRLEASIEEMQNFVVIEPSSLDPFGIVKKIDQIFRTMERRFEEFVDEVAPKKSRKEKREINFALRAAIGVHSIAKLVRHYVELIKRFRNLQLALILQMQLPLIERIAKSEYAGVEAFVKGLPVGDGIGPLCAALLIEGEAKPIAEDVVAYEREIEGRKVIVLKATGPEPSLGRIDEAIAKLVKGRKVAKVITIDAATKLEGERTGSVASGVGFAMGSFEREIAENVLLPRGIPIEAIVIKVGFEEAIEPMKPEIAEASKVVLEHLRQMISRTRRKGVIIVAGIGNSSGIGNDRREALKAIELVKRIRTRRVVKRKTFVFKRVEKQ